MTAGRDLRAAREDCGVGLGALAQLIGRDKGHLSRVERGDREATPALIADYERALDTVIAATGPLADKADAGDTDDVRRRDFLSLVAAASVGAGASDPVMRLLDGLDSPLPSRVTVGEVEAVEHATDLYMSMDLARSGDLAATMARSCLRWAAGLLDQSMTDPVRDRLSSAVGLLGDRLGWALYDSGDKRTASRLLTAALNHAARGPDRDLRAHVMLDLSSVLTDAGRADNGVETLRLALGDERMSSAERANLHAVCARHCAAAGQLDAGLRHVSLAEDTLARVDPGLAPEWARRITYSPGHHDSALGLALFALGDASRAHLRLSAAVDALDAKRTRTGLRCRTRLAVLHLRDGDRTGGETHARYVLRDVAGVTSTRVRSDLVMLRQAATSSGARELAAELSGVLGAA